MSTVSSWIFVKEKEEGGQLWKYERMGGNEIIWKESKYECVDRKMKVEIKENKIKEKGYVMLKEMIWKLREENIKKGESRK